MSNIPEVQSGNLSAAARALDALHFEQVLDLLNHHPQWACEDPFWYQMFQAKALRGLYRYQQALAVLDQINPENPAQRAWLKTEKGKLLFSMGKVKDAQSVLRTALQDLSLPFLPDLSLALASLYAQEGKVKQALEEADPVIQYFDSIQKPKASLYTEMCTLLGDLNTFSNQFEQAKSWYEKGLQSIPDCIAKNWQPLRYALLENNLADLYEQEEDWDNALKCYLRARDHLERLSDDQISDLSSYRMELIFSYANLLANMDEYDQAIEELAKAEAVFKNRPPMQHDYFLARLRSFTGLFPLYRNRDARDMNTALNSLQQAFSIQKELSAKGLDKEEHAAKSAYYLAWCLEDRDPGKIRLYQYILPIFKKLYQKEPVFYLDGIAQIYNDLGRLESEKDPVRAEEYLKKACSVYEDLYRRCPGELFSARSLLVALLNLSGLYARLQKKDKEPAEKIVSLLEEVSRKDFAGAMELFDTADQFALSCSHTHLKSALDKWAARYARLH